jgi:hypothetical protein
MIRLGGRASILLVLMACAIVALVLVIPIPAARHHRLLNAVLNLGHVPLFAFLGWIVLRLLGNSVWTVGGLVAVVIGGEWIQIWAPGRTPDWVDAEHGFIGIAIAWSAWMLAHRPAIALLMGAVLFAVPLARVVPEMGDVASGWSDFPVLARFDQPWSERRWKTHGATLELEKDAAGGWFGSLRLDGDDEFPGAELVPVATDWRGWSRLMMEIELDAELNLFLTVRDQRPTFGFGERFNGERKLGAGRQCWELPLAEVEKTPGGRPLNLAEIDSINLFVSPQDAGRAIKIRRVWLEK